MIKTFFYVSIFLTTFFGVEAFRNWSKRRNIYDVPNERSSHIAPTPRGGGLIIAATCLSAIIGYCLIFHINFYWSYITGAVIIVLISWLDDLYSISAFQRFLCQAAAALLVVWGLGYWESVYFPFAGTIYFGQFGIFITFFWIVWMVNAYNFMDGIDGIAATQAVVAGVGWMIIGILLGVEIIGFYSGVIAFSSLGFLFHNWQPAKIFMGDVGSAFLGFSFAVLPLFAKTEGASDNFSLPLFPLVAISLVWLFLYDSVTTLFLRILKGKKIWHAHREHIYQKLVIYGYTHRFVSILYGANAMLTTIFLVYAVQTNINKAVSLILLMLFQALTVTGLLIFSKSQIELED